MARKGGREEGKVHTATKGEARYFPDNGQETKGKTQKGVEMQKGKGGGVRTWKKNGNEHPDESSSKGQRKGKRGESHGENRRMGEKKKGEKFQRAGADEERLDWRQRRRQRTTGKP